MSFDAMRPAAPHSLIDALQRELQRTQRAPVVRVETHLSWLLLGDEHAYKVKKPLALPFVDFTTLASRQHFCAEEVRLNRRLAPALYLGVVAIGGGADAPVLGGGGPAIEYAVRMRRFPPGALLSERLAAGTLQPDEVDRLAARIAAFHRDAAVAPASAQRVGSDGAAALRALAGVAARFGERACAPLRRWLGAEAERLAALWQTRLDNGCVRECHGDLHLANTLSIDGEVTAFDAVEFDPALRWIDVLADIAFLVMDLAAHRRDDLAARCLDRYLEATGDHDGLPTLRFFMVYRALVRSQVGLLREAQGGTPSGPSPRAYLALARRLAAGARPRLLITHGLPGSGKSFFSARLLERSGAVRVRADVERKRLCGLAPLDDSRLRPELNLYASAATRRTYERLLRIARVSLQAGCRTIVDAAFLRRAERDRFAALARERGVPFAILDCRAPPPLLRQRVAERCMRRDDASEADLAVLDLLAARCEPLADDESGHAIVADADSDPRSLAARWFGTTL